MQIRKIGSQDLERCAQLLESAYSQAPYDESFDEGAALGYIKSKFNHCADSSFVLVDDGSVAGFIFTSLSHWSNGPQAVMEEVVVNESKRGKGYGKELVQYVHDYLSSQGVKSIMLWVNKNADAFHFHQKNGYLPADEFVVMFKNF